MGANLALSTDRALAVARELAALGVVEDRIVAEGHASKNPVAAGTDDESLAANRRVEVSVGCG